MGAGAELAAQVNKDEQRMISSAVDATPGTLTREGLLTRAILLEYSSPGLSALLPMQNTAHSELLRLLSLIPTRTAANVCKARLMRQGRCPWAPANATPG